MKVTQENPNSIWGTAGPEVLYLLQSEQPDWPNYDMGFSDIGCFGSEVSTPNLYRLAERGIRVSQFYNNPRCCPSRASIMTGLYAQQAAWG